MAHLRSLSILITLLITGCGKTQSISTDATVNLSDDAIRTVSNQTLKPKDYLETIFSRYRAAGSYRDEGRVLLRTQEDGRMVEKEAPLRVWFNHMTVYVEAYDTRLWSDQTSVTAWIVDPSTNHFDSQVLRSSSVNRRPKVDELLTDPILVAHIAAGLAGPPPQLEWLFSPVPMQKLFNKSHTFSYGRQLEIDGRRCQSIVVRADAQQYSFWVDVQRGLIRRVELPAITTNPSRESVELTLDLCDATFDAPSSKPNISPLPKRPNYVTRFLPLPPPEPNALFGKKIEPNRWLLDHRTFELAHNKSGQNSSVKILIFVADDPNTLNSLHLMAEWFDRMPSKMKQRIDVYGVLDRELRDYSSTVASFLQDGFQIPLIDASKSDTAVELGVTPNTMYVVGHTGRIEWLSPLLTPGALPAFGTVVADVLNGADVPKRIREQWQAEHQFYRKALREERQKLADDQLLSL